MCAAKVSIFPLPRVEIILQLKLHATQLAAVEIT